MKTLKVKFIINNDNTLQVPAELFLFIGKQLKHENVEKLYIDIDSTNKKFIEQTVNNFIDYYQIKNIRFRNFDNNYQTVSFDNNIYFMENFSPKNINPNKLIFHYISYYEEFWGKVPFYTQENCFNEKISFINDIILQLGDDLFTH